MAILDLLASITGEESSPSSNPLSRPTPILGKRKADDGIRTAGPKVARVDAMPEKPSRPNGHPTRPSPRPSERPPDASRDKQSSNPRPVSDNSSQKAKPSSTGSRARAPGTMPANGTKPLPSRAPVNRPSPTDSGPPKKRSYAEIMARAKANSEQRESLGKIQHKTVERSLTLKERKELKLEEARKAKMEARKLGAGGPRAMGASRDIAKMSGARSGVSSTSASVAKTAPAEPKKIKKAALATTGYTGTARPRPGASATAKSGVAGRPIADARARDKPRYGGPLASSRNKYDEGDDLDDFIVDDEDEEEQPGIGNPGRYQYYSDEEESDMEAGISDIEDEEQRAERQARREDLEQEALEKRLKQEKEERRRRFLEATKAKAGGR